MADVSCWPRLTRRPVFDLGWAALLSTTSFPSGGEPYRSGPAYEVVAGAVLRSGPADSADLQLDPTGPSIRAPPATALRQSSVAAPGLTTLRRWRCLLPCSDQLFPLRRLKGEAMHGSVEHKSQVSLTIKACWPLFHSMTGDGGEPGCPYKRR